MKLVKCVRASAEEINESMCYSRAKYSADGISLGASVSQQIAQVFIPEDATVEQEIFTTWIAE